MSLSTVVLNNRPLAWKTRWAPRTDFAYTREPVHYIRLDHDPADRWRITPAAGETTWSVYPPQPGFTRSADGTLSGWFDQPGHYALLCGDTVRGWIFLDAAGAYTRPADAVDGRSCGVLPNTGRPVTDVLNAALARLSASGGGTLSLGPGLYETGTVHMRSHTSLHLEDGAVLQASLNLDAHPLDDPALAPTHLPRSLQPGTHRRLVYFDHVENSGLLGRGTVCGQGSELRRLHTRPRAMMQLVRAVGCRRLRFEGVFLRDSEFWNTHLIHCDDVRFDGVKVLNEIPPPAWDSAWRPGSKSIWNNADGINPDSSTRVVIKDCFFHTGDDCVPVKNTGCHLDRLADVHDITVKRCLMRTPVTALKVGTETRGGRIGRVVFEDIHIVGCSRVIGVDLKDGAHAHDLTFRDIHVLRCNRPFDFWILHREDETGQRRFSRLRNVSVDGLCIDRMGTEGSNQTSHITGRDADHNVHGVVLNKLHIEGRAITSLADLDLETNAFATGVELIAEPAVEALPAMADAARAGFATP